MKIIEQIKYKYKTGNLAIRLIAWNLIFFVVGLLASLVSPNRFNSWVYLSSSLEELLYKPWTLVTYSFFHSQKEISHLLFNMLLLYFLGDIFLRFFRNKDLAQFYFGGAIAGGIAFLGYAQLNSAGTIDALSSHSNLLGASAAIYAVLFAIVAYRPKLEMSLMLTNIKIPMDYIAYGLIIWDTIQILMNDNPGGRVSHFGGAIFGFAYMKQFEKGNAFLAPITNWFYAFSLPKFNFTKQAKNNEEKIPRDDYDFQNYKSQQQQKLDKILDKISDSGYESLTKKEKEFLFKAGNNP